MSITNRADRPLCGFLFLISVLVAPPSFAYPSGAGTCSYPNAGWSEMGSGFEGTGGFVIRVLDGADPVTQYVPGHTYTVEISNSIGYAGFLLQSVRGVPGTPDAEGVGTFSFENLSLYQQNAICTNPASSVTHTLTRPPQRLLVDRFSWLAPEAGTGSVTLHLIGVVSRFEWYGRGAAITLTLLEGVSAVDSRSWGAVRSLYR